jgi:hypothetical protein
MVASPGIVTPSKFMVRNSLFNCMNIILNVTLCVKRIWSGSRNFCKPFRLMQANHYWERSYANLTLPVLSRVEGTKKGEDVSTLGLSFFSLLFVSCCSTADKMLSMKLAA